MKTITITISVPDGVNVSVGQGQAASKPFVAREAPPAPDDYCPVHDVAWKLVPAGVSKTKFDDNGNPKPYNAFWACPERGCNEKPGRYDTEPGAGLPF